ncbi:hypothetical protein PO124_14930 [Bacillus licheniformis]|nr:hypothetical protein [Bacillus licheniformis]
MESDRQGISLPFKDIAVLLGMGWLATLVVLDAIYHPAETAIFYEYNIALGLCMGAERHIVQIFAKVNKPTGIPRPSLWLSFALAVFGRFRFRLGTRSSMFALLP